MSGLSEAELHAQAMRLVCEALADREQQGIEVDWDVLRQMHDQMDAMLQALQHKHRYDSSEIVDLRKDRDAARAEIETLKGAMDADEQRLRDAEDRVWPYVTWGCDAPDKMADEILHLRQQLAEQQAETVDVRRQRNNETDRLNATNAVSVQQRDEIAYLRTRLDEERSVIAGLRQQLDAAQAAVALQRAGIERLQAFVATVRRVDDAWGENENVVDYVLGLQSALAELDEEPAPATEPAPVAEPARCPECERLRAELETANEHRTDLVLFVDKVRKCFRVWGSDDTFIHSVSHALAELDTNSSATPTSSVVKESLTPAPVGEPIDAEDGK